MPVFICSRQYTLSMHENEVKLLLFVSWIWNEKCVYKMCRHILQCPWRHRHWTLCELIVDCLKVSFCRELVVMSSTSPYQIKPWWVIRSLQLWSVHCTDANCVQIRLADRHTFIWLVETPEASGLLADGACSALMTGTSRYKTFWHSLRSKSEIIHPPWSQCYCILLLVPMT